MKGKTTAVSVANAKRAFSDLLGRVAYGRETVVITRRGKPMARLVPVEADEGERALMKRRGFLENDDPFFEIVEQVVEERARHVPRVLSPPRTSKKGPRRRK